jgi:hypothetical protein
MTNLKITIILFSITAILLTTVTPIFALDYNPGVSPGQYIKYGNFIGEGPGFELFNDYDWQKIQIVETSNKEITLLFTGQFKDGTPTPGNNSTTVWNIETGTENGIPSTQGPIIAANLNQGEPIPPPETFTINNTETRTYLGVSREVNVLNIALSTPDYNLTTQFVYDKISGILLEASSETTQGQTSPITSKYSYSITETNIFSSESPSPTTTTPPQNTIQPTQPTNFPSDSPYQSPQQPTNQNIPFEYILIIVIITLVILLIIAAILIKKQNKL